MEEKIVVTNIDRIILVGQDEYKEETSVFMKQRPFQELTLFLSGETTIRFDDQVLYTKPYAISYLPEGTHKKYIVERQQKGDCIIIYFNSTVPLAEQAFIIETKQEKYETLFKKIVSVWKKNDEGRYFECMSLLYKILAQMKKTRYLTETRLKKIQPAVDYIESNYLKESVSSEKMVALCGISYSYIKKIFTLKYKTSPKKYAVSLKMNHACKLLSSGEYTVSQTAELCGFSDIYFFSRQFKEYIGVSPLNFIKNYKSSKK